MSEYSFETTLKDGVQKGKYLNKMGSRIVLGEGGKVESFKDYSGLETTLLAVCLYDENNVLVKDSVMQTWPATVLGKLFDLAQELSGLNEESKKKMEAEAKNS
jgi:hypothetical protein